MKNFEMTTAGAIIFALVGCEQPSMTNPGTNLDVYHSSHFFENFSFDPLPTDDEREILVPWVTLEGRGEAAFGAYLSPPYREYSGRFKYVDEHTNFPAEDLLKLVKLEFRDAPAIKWVSDPKFGYFYEAQYEGEANRVGYISLTFIPDLSNKTVVVRYTMTETSKR